MNFEENDFISLVKSEIDCAGFNLTNRCVWSGMQ